MTVRLGELRDLLRYAPDAAEVMLQLRDEPPYYLTGTVQPNSYPTAEPWEARVTIRITEERETEAEEYERRFWRTVNVFRETLEEDIAGLPEDHHLVRLFDHFIKPIDEAGDMANE